MPGSHSGYWLGRTLKRRGVWLGGQSTGGITPPLRRRAARATAAAAGRGAEMKIKTTFFERIEITGTPTEMQAAYDHCAAYGYRIVFSSCIKDTTMHYSEGVVVVGEKEVQLAEIKNESLNNL